MLFNYVYCIQKVCSIKHTIMSLKLNKFNKNLILSLFFLFLVSNCNQDEVVPQWQPKERSVKYLNGSEIPEIVGKLFETTSTLTKDSVLIMVF